MAKYINEKDIYNLFPQSGIERLHVAQIDELPRADVGKIVRDVLSDLKRQVHSKAIYPDAISVYPFITIKAFDAIVQNYINKYSEDRK